MVEITKDDFELVHGLFSQIAPVSVSDIEGISPFLKKASFKKDEQLLEPGQIERRVNLVTKGIVHLYTYIDGEVFTINISLPGMLFNSLDSYVHNRPTSEIQETVSDVDLLYLEKSDVISLMQNNNTFCFIYAKLFEFQLSLREYRMLLLQYKSALKRFDFFMNSTPNAQRYLQEVPQKLVAQYLGLAPETFCRAKNQYLKDQ